MTFAVFTAKSRDGGLGAIGINVSGSFLPGLLTGLAASMIV